MKEIKLQFRGHKKYKDESKPLSDSYIYFNNISIPEDRVNDIEYIGSAILDRIYNKIYNEEFKNEVSYVDGIITFDARAEDYPKLFGSEISIKNIEEENNSLIGSITIESKRGDFFKPAYVVYHIFDKLEDMYGKTIKNKHFWSTNLEDIKKFAKENGCYTPPVEKYCVSKDLKNIYKLITTTNVFMSRFTEKRIKWRCKIYENRDSTIPKENEINEVLKIIKEEYKLWLEWKL